MSQNYFNTNGSSLEDCHTNFFALADLCGIKWRKYTCDKYSCEPLEDPVLNSYAKCINANLLCVWRRSRQNNTHEQTNRLLLESHYSKELWIFWYGDEPDFSDLISNNLIDGELGSWENGLSYDCRTLLFTALHNLIERSLLSKGYARIGRWFFLVKYGSPAKSIVHQGKSDKLNEAMQVTFTFNFFLHGDSNVCANVDVRQHAALFPVTREDIQFAQSVAGGLRVILAPYGLQAYLTGHVYKDNDPKVQKFIVDWKKLYPLANLSSKGSKDSCNLHLGSSFNNLHNNVTENKSADGGEYLWKIVEIIIDNCKMKYPVCYIFITQQDHELITTSNDQTNSSTTADAAHSFNTLSDSSSNDSFQHNKLMMTPYCVQVPTDSFHLRSNANHVSTYSDSLLTDRLSQDESNDCINRYMNELLFKKNCNCPKCQQVTLRRQLKSQNAFNSFGSFVGKLKDRGLDKEKAKYLKNSLPFHQRASLHISSEADYTISTCSLVQPSSVVTAASPINTSVNLATSLSQSTVLPSIISYKSPVSTSTSSVLNTPGIETSPMSNFNLDNAEHHASPSREELALTTLNTPINVSNQSPKESKNGADSMSPGVNGTKVDIKQTESSLESGTSVVDNGKPPGENLHPVSSAHNDVYLDKALFLKRSLSFKNIYDGETSLRNGLLYDFSYESQMWDLPPPKNRRLIHDSDPLDYKDFNENYFSNEMSQYKCKDPYEFNEIEDVEKNSALRTECETVESTDNLVAFESVAKMSKHTSEPEVNGFKNIVNSKSRNDDDYVSSFGEIDFFNSPSEESNENLPAPLTTTGKLHNGIQSATTTNISAETESLISAANFHELQRMFPTPPSLEAMVQSPCNTNTTTCNNSNSTHTGPEVKTELVQETTEKNKASQNNSVYTETDWSFVYRPPVQSSFITSNKYAPLENIEFHINLPPHCYYKHNVRKQSTEKNNKEIQSQNSASPLNGTAVGMVIPKTKSAYNLLNASKFNPTQFPNPLMRGVRPNGPNMTVINANYLNRVRPGLNMQPHLYNFPSDNFNNFRQNSPSLNLDSNTMSPMAANSFISSPAANFDNRRSPFPLQSGPLNSPSNGGPSFMSSSPLSSYNMQQKMSPMLSVSFFANSNLEASHHLNSASLLSESNSLMLNLLLSDSMLNVFRDHNFESCSICVCNMNIKGNDVGVYLPDIGSQQSQSNNYDNYYPCSCGFSALSNRHRSQFSGLFLEDEMEITGVFYDPAEKAFVTDEQLVESNFFDKELKKNLQDVDENLVDLLISLSTTVFSSSSILAKMIYCDYRAAFRPFSLKDSLHRHTDRDPLVLMYKDYTKVINLALSIIRADAATAKQGLAMVPLPSSRPVLHEWPFRNAFFPTNNHEVIFVLKTLQPLMQEAVQRKSSGNCEVTYNTVKGPLTWRQFHRLAGRGGTEYQCEPQPIPSVLVGHDKDCVVISPFALKFWEKLSLEPYAVTRDVSYIILAPSNEYLLRLIRNFFKELTSTFELLRFGRHTPLRKLFSDGICVVNANISKKCDSPPLDDWFGQLGESELANKIRHYAQAFFNLVPSLSQYNRSLFESGSNSKSHSDCSFSPSGNIGSGSSSGSSSMTNGTISNSFISNSMNSMSSQFGNLSQRTMNNTYGSVNHTADGQTDRMHHEGEYFHNSNHDPSICQVSTALQPYEDEDDMHKLPSVIIYVIDPFASFGPEAAKLGCLGLLKSFAHMLKYIPENVRNNIHLQPLSLDSIVSNSKDFRDTSRQNQLKELSFSVFSQCRQQLTIHPSIKSLTGLGPAASFEVFLKSKESMYNQAQLYTTPFTLAPLKDKQTELGEMFGDRRVKSHILFCCYCLSEDQRWLFVSCTNDKGDILHTKLINISVPNRARRRNTPVRRFGLDKLMSFVQTIMSESVLPWRLVIGRLGRMGHGELKDWTVLLSKKYLLKYSRQLREMCAQCHDLGPQDQPSVYSACLISLEADTALRVFPNYYTPDERFSSSCTTCSLSTPEDASCTHILVFPTSATTQSAHANFSLMDLGANLGEEFFTSLDDADIPVEDDLDFANFWNDNMLGDDPHQNGPQADSPTNRQAFGGSVLKNSTLVDEQEEPAQLLQQPLALAFYVSTAPTGPLPKWFWAHSPHLENTCPVFLKSALLIHTPFVQQNSDDLLHGNIQTRDCHPLDSSLTTDVLRCVLEGYNSLSWLTLNPGTSDRLSCLPLHIQALMQLYHSVQALI